MAEKNNNAVKREFQPSGFHNRQIDRKSTRLNSSHANISYAVFCLKTKDHTSELQSRQYIVCRLLLDKEENARFMQISIGVVTGYSKESREVWRATGRHYESCEH